MVDTGRNHRARRDACGCCCEGREELGVEIQPTDIIGVFGGPGFEIRYDNGDVTAYVTTVFHCQILKGEIEPDGVEVHEAAFAGPDEWQVLDVPEWLHSVLPQVFHWLQGDDRAARFEGGAARATPSG